jgi:ketosteroid isomerase-like protein
MLMPHHLEKWVLMVDGNNNSGASGMSEMFGSLFEMISKNFPQSLEKILLVDFGDVQNVGSNLNSKGNCDP